jgi:hypothetical protein
MPARLAVDAEVYASHHQFYVVDERSEPSGGDVWDGHGLERHLGVADGIVAVGTIGYTFLPVVLELWDEEPPLDLGDWDHVVEARLDVASGRVGLQGVEGPAELDPLEVEPGTYRVRSSAAGLADADELDGGDRYRVQLWPAPAASPEVRKWWAPWRPGTPGPSVEGGRIIVGAEAHDRRVQMEWLASRGYEHLFRDAEGRLWEHSTLQDASGTPQLEELAADEAERRYGGAEEWGPPATVRPSTAQMLKNVWPTWRYSRGWRPPPENRA